MRRKLRRMKSRRLTFRSWRLKAMSESMEQALKKAQQRVAELEMNEAGRKAHAVAPITRSELDGLRKRDPKAAMELVREGKRRIVDDPV
jgi:hypothetical protein